MNIARGYLTLGRASAAAHGKPILRLLADPQELFIIIPSLDTTIYVLTADSPRGRHENAGSMTAMGIVDREIAKGEITVERIAEWRKWQGEGMTSAIGEFTPPEFWELLDAYEALIGAKGER